MNSSNICSIDQGVDMSELRLKANQGNKFFIVLLLLLSKC